jgi:hypothetical protein
MWAVLLTFRQLHADYMLMVVVIRVSECPLAYFLKARTVEPEKQQLLGNSYVTRNSAVTVGSGVFSSSTLLLTFQ